MTEETSNDIEEEWRSISGYPNYEVSNLGRVRIIKARHIKQLRSGKDGCLMTNLNENNTMNTHRVHRLVAQAFIDNPDNKTEVDNVDHNRHNNSINNLRWATSTENNMNRHKQKNNARPILKAFLGINETRNGHLTSNQYRV